MKTEADVNAFLKSRQRQLKTTRTRFNKYDNVDDMHAIDEIEAEIEILKWVLEKPSIFDPA